VVTTFCTLRCKHCAHLNAYYYFLPRGKEQLKFFDADEIIETVKKILESVDEIREMSVDGGEPFMHRQLSKILKFIVQAEKIKRIEVVTNGTLCPNEDALQTLKNKKIYVTISDYGDVSIKVKELQVILKKNNVSHRVQVQGYGWDDLGEHYNRNRGISELKKTYNTCFDTRYKLILDKKIYDCHRVANAVYLGLHDPSKFEEIDVFKWNATELREKIRGLYFNKYIPYCNYCNGKGKLVVAGLQFTDEEIRQLREKNNYYKSMD
jgi:organic radical activating enzyme